MNGVHRWTLSRVKQATKSSRMLYQIPCSADVLMYRYSV
jgi:hypothetical protein